MKNVAHIKELLAGKKQALFKNYAIKSLAIFGSYSRNEQNSLSDVDLLVEFNKKIGIEFIDLADELEEIIGTKVDLVSINGIKKKYFQSISSDLIYV
ncbi:nucleotidyltransferase family protein [uncultured Polaribacter sp.]|uniref:nucleotidyltransferase family protein n=1 Tax=uncultured Polaribacter sp. TaxID=174711 RepID=UPI0026264412|nr:nucleotidyltransferase family protein [uncultured Polaribacter sp.]